MTKKTNLLKMAGFTDLHWGKKANSEQHNNDCMEFIDWFCDNVKKDPSIDCIGFLGDWHESRSALNVSTLNYSYLGAKKLNELGLPVYFIVGNHDLYHRNTREVYSVVPFTEFSNFVIIDKPTVIEEIKGTALFSPYLFHEEYPELVKYLKIPNWFGHFEFKGFWITGYSMKMPNGPDMEDYIGPKNIFSGHFHKRQINKHVTYVGNAFPMDFNDAGDNERGMFTVDFNTNKFDFTNWVECPKYINSSLSRLLDDSVAIHKRSRVKCEVDVPITFEESNLIREKFISEYELREFIMEESSHIVDALTTTESSVNETDVKLAGVDTLVVQMLQDIDTQHIDNNMLIKIYQDIRI